MSDHKYSISREIFVAVSAAVLSTIILAWLGFKDKENTTAQPAPPPTLHPKSVDLSSRIGVYIGQSVNKTYHGQGIALLDIRNIENSSGRVSAQITWSRGLTGEGSLSGIMENNGLMELSGTILSEAGIWDTDLHCKFVDQRSVRCRYRLYPKPGNPYGTQDGEFSASYRYR